MARTKKDLMQSVENDYQFEQIVKARIVKGNTLEIETENNINIRLHDTDIIKFDKSCNIIQLNTGNWYTVTTKSRINEFINRFTDNLIQISIFQNKYTWYVRIYNIKTDKCIIKEYYDYMKISSDGNIITDQN